MVEKYLSLSETDKKMFLESLHAYDLKDLYESLDEANQTLFFDLLNDTQKADLLSYLDTTDAAEIISELKSDEQSSILKEMEPDDAIDIINELEDIDKQAIIEQLDETDLETYERLSSYDEDQTGSIMTTLYIQVTQDLEIKQVMKKLIELAPLVESISKIYVTDKHNLFLGIVPLKKLIKAKSPMLIEDLYEPSPFVLDKDDKEDSVDYIQTEGIYDCPVLNEKHELVGIITIDDALDTYEEEMIEDFQKMSMLNEDLDNSVFKNAFKRLPWLLFLLILALPIASLAQSFEGVLQTYTIIVILQPLMLAMVGNAGTQTLSFYLIMISDDEPSNIIKKNMLFELLSGMMTGIVLAILSFLITIIIMMATNNQSHMILFAFIVSIALFIAMTIGTLFSSFTPITLNKIGIDPAVASGPLITTFIDLSTVIIYYGLAAFFVGVFL